MVDAVAIVGIVGTLAVALMIVGMLYLVFLGYQSDKSAFTAEAEAADADSEGVDPEPDPE